ncbi:MAG: GAF domain-containing protein [Chloroflexi bacterium]|nr:GAF domain-containing protein [Chloroflexota bacterium]
MIDQLKKFFAAPTFADEADNRTANLLNTVTWVYLGLVILGFITGLSLFASKASSDTIIFTFAIRVVPFLTANILGQILMRLGRVRAASYVFVGLLWLGHTASMFVNGGIGSTAFAFYFLTVFLAGLFLDSRGIFITLIFSIGAGGLALAAENRGALLTSAAGEGSATVDYITLSFGFTITAVVLYLFMKELGAAIQKAQTANVALQEASKLLEERVADRTRDLELAAEVGRNLSRVYNLEELLRQATENIRSRFDLYYTQIYLVDAAGSELLLRAGTGDVGQKLLVRGHRLPLNAGSINGAAAVNREAVIVADTESSPFFRSNPLLPDTRSEMAVPLIVSEKIVGVIDLQSTRSQALSEENLVAFEILAGQLATAIENARLIRDTNQVRKELETRVRQDVRQAWTQYLDGIEHGERIGFRFDENEVSAVTGPPVEISDNGRQLSIPITLAGEPVGVIEFEGTDIPTWSDNDLELVDSVANQISQQLENLRLLDEAERYRQEAEEATHRLIREGWDDFQQRDQEAGFVYDQVNVKPFSETDADAEGETSMVPLAIQGEPIGRLEIAGVEMKREQNSAFLTAVAARLSAHIENLRLNQQTETALAEAQRRSEELDTLNTMGAAFTTAHDLEEILNSIYQYSSQLIPQSIDLYVALYDEAADEIAIYLFYNPNEETPAGELQSVIRRQSGNGITEYILRSRKPLLINGDISPVAEELGFDAIGAKSQSWLGVPMIIGERALGVIAIQSFETADLYHEHHLDLLTAVASSAAISLDNIRLLMQVQGRARQEQILREVTAHVHAAIDAEAIMRTAAQEINRQLGLETFVYLDNQQEPEASSVNGDNGHDSSTSN